MWDRRFVQQMWPSSGWPTQPEPSLDRTRFIEFLGFGYANPVGHAQRPGDPPRCRGGAGALVPLQLAQACLCDDPGMPQPNPSGPDSGLGSGLDFGSFDALTFDCYGTLIDWETGILRALHEVARSRDATVEDEWLLDVFGRHEAAIEAGPYRRYREVLAETLRRISAELGFESTAAEGARFGGSVANWPAFPDSSEALQRLKQRFGLGVITNCDDDLFAASNQRLGVNFDWIITAEQAGSYKPDHHNFQLAFERIGLPRDRILHVAQSLFHDHVPAKRLGLSTVWVDRRHDRPGTGATPPAEATPDVTVPDIRTLADLATGELR